MEEDDLIEIDIPARVLAIVGIASIFIPFADGTCKKDPWNWEYDVAESGVAAKKALLEAEKAHTV